MQQIQFHELSTQEKFDFGSAKLSEDDIIRFAERYDPLPMHTNREAAAESPFGKLIASGPHLFHIFYTREWVPRFGASVYAGKGIESWLMKRPVFADVESFCQVTIKNITPKPDRGFGVVHWYFEFTDHEKEILQELDLVVMHKL